MYCMHTKFTVYFLLLFASRVSETSPMDQIYVLFEMIKIPCVFVVSTDGALLGMISRHSLLNSLKLKNKSN